MILEKCNSRCVLQEREGQSEGEWQTFGDGRTQSFTVQTPRAYSSSGKGKRYGLDTHNYMISSPFDGNLCYGTDMIVFTTTCTACVVFCSTSSCRVQLCILAFTIPIEVGSRFIFLYNLGVYFRFDRNKTESYCCPGSFST